MKRGTNIDTIAGVYSITNVVNNKFYIGSSKNLLKRFYQHRWQLRNGCHSNRHLQSAWAKYDGEEHFVFEILKICEACDLLAEEQFAIDNLKPEYNHRKIADSNTGLIGINAEIDDETVKSLIITYMSNPEMTLKELGQQFGGISESYVQQLISGQQRSYIVLDNAELQAKLDNIRTMANYRNTAQRGSSKLNPDCIIIIKELLKSLSINDIASHYDVHPEAIRRIQRGDSWHIIKDIDKLLYDYIRSPECQYEVQNENTQFSTPVSIIYGLERCMIMHTKLYHLEDRSRDTQDDEERGRIKEKIDYFNGVTRPMLLAGLSQLLLQAIQTKDTNIVSEPNLKSYGGSNG